jgi:regulator of cell morphogenesis and NO signaling
MNKIAEQTLAGIVTRDHRAATVLEKYQLDFCCKGKRTLAEACAEKGLSTEAIASELQSASAVDKDHQMPFTQMTAEQLIAHILIHHHFYVKQSMPQIYEHVARVAMKHGDRFPYMIDVFERFAEVQQEMNKHMHKEEMILFPAIKKAEAAIQSGHALNGEARIIQGAINVMEAEHDEAGAHLFRIRELTNNYEEPVGACTTFRVSLAELKAFEEDLHKHVHLENNILFPMAAGFVE